MPLPPRRAQQVDVFRDTVTTDRDEFGDDVETVNPPVHVGVPVWISEQEQRIPVDGDLRLVKVLLGRAAGGTDIRAGDRLRSAGGDWFAVTSATQPGWSRFRPPDLRLELTRTTAESAPPSPS